MAAVLWAGDEALVSHAAAAVLWGFLGARARKVELWVPPNRGIRSSLVVVHRGKRLDRADRTILGPIPITTPARTLIDIAGRLEDDRLLAVTEDLIRRDLATPDRLYARLDALRTSGRTGGGRLEALLDARGDGRPLESALEALAWRIICSSGVPLPARQHWVILPGGRYRLDFAWPDLKIGLECEGHEFHGGRSAWGKDRARFAEFGAAGWRVVPLTWDACSREPRRVTRWIKDALENAA
jgi:very-short-patch-repair endonuclease